MRLPFLLMSFLLGQSLSIKVPEDDEFYAPPHDYIDARLGEILKVRPPPSSIRSLLAPITAIPWQLLIRSEDSFGNPNVVTATILEPPGADSQKVLSYQTFQNSAKRSCCPSYTMLTASFESLEIQADLAFISMALFMKWYVLIPDYEGPKSAFPVSKQSAHAVLNCMKAAKTFISQDASFAMMGYSGGAFASAWAAILQPKYAPELKLVGAALGGTIANISALIRKVDGGPYAGLVVNILNGLGNEYKKFKLALHVYGPSLKSYCLFSAATHYFGTSFNKDVYQDILEDKTINSIFNENDLLGANKTVPRAPMFLYHSAINEVAPFKEVDKLYDYWCEQGVTVELAEDMSFNHMMEAFAGIPASITWLNKRFKKEPILDHCKRSKKTSNFFYPGSPRFIRKKLKHTLSQIVSQLIVI
ncbi:hypothetical protein KGF56_000316 [Candida oxycetoniae]|uniref:Lipase n=1 Tax=Candida oxycetoniae TaxID=497107 RepID=A0AAI9T2B5_9ASCO|nr:uncharacterized protein KGF56_000316 [Candida oxycetoniae]KAI3406855.2 hypothetical protein KGF56_000316 [Candida oxycetoniae]